MSQPYFPSTIPNYAVDVRRLESLGLLLSTFLRQYEPRKTLLTSRLALYDPGMAHGHGQGTQDSFLSLQCPKIIWIRYELCVCLQLDAFSNTMTALPYTDIFVKVANIFLIEYFMCI